MRCVPTPMRNEQHSCSLSDEHPETPCFVEHGAQGRGGRGRSVSVLCIFGDVGTPVRPARSIFVT